MDRKPLITYAGDEKLFQSIQTGLTEGLPEESVEWHRNLGRVPRDVYVSANFVPFSDKVFQKEKHPSLLGQPFFHTYWTDCSDLESYKQTVKENIGLWLFKLRTRDINDWLIVVVDNVDSKKGNKSKLLSRTTVLDKIKNDFLSKSTDKCISLLDPCRSDGRAAESWRSLLHRIRTLLVLSYGYKLGSFEEYMRTQREKRNESTWVFNEFFSLQEEMAFILELLGLYDEALVQYDELDALFTQFVINSNVGGMPDWLVKFTQPGNTWSGICLDKAKTLSLHSSVGQGELGLLDFGSYLFSRQCNLLLMLCRPWEVAQRSLPFLHNCVSELRILEITMPSGAVNCWLFLSCLEILQTCEKFSDSTQMETYSLYTASLWSYAKEKLNDLGKLCHLMPESKMESQHLHLVVNLLSGIDDEDELQTAIPPTFQTPKSKLREALSSKDYFLKHYFEISELTMGTYKHIGRIRTARFIGRDLAHLYIKLNQPHKAVSFLTDLLNNFRSERWEKLLVQTQIELANCYLAMEDDKRYLKMCARISSSPSLPKDLKEHYFEKVISYKEKLTDPYRLRTDYLLHVEDAKIFHASPVIIGGTEIILSMIIESRLPREITCKSIKVAISSLTDAKVNGVNRLGTSPRFEYYENNSRACVPLLSSQFSSQAANSGPVSSIVCTNLHQVLKRLDSHGGLHRETEIPKADFNHCFSVENAVLLPGPNHFSLINLARQPGVYQLSQLCLQWDNFWFVQPSLSPTISYSVIEETPIISLQRTKDLLAGVPQKVDLDISSGSYHIKNNPTLSVVPSLALDAKHNLEDEWSRDLKVSLPEVEPFKTITITIYVLANLRPQRDANTIEHRLNLQGSWNPDNSQPISIDFLPPFLNSHKLHTFDKKKFLQVVVHGLTSTMFSLKEPQLFVSDSHKVPIKLLNPSSAVLDVVSNVSASFLWELGLPDNSPPPLKFLFKIQYCRKTFEKDSWRSYQCEIKLTEYVTLYSVLARVEPPKGSEFCRAASMCQMNIVITQLCQTNHTSLMYEVVVDQTLWAVCGRTAGVVNIDASGKYSLSLDAMPLIGGYLPLPTVRLSKYIPSDNQRQTDGLNSRAQSVARLEPFDPGQVYSWGRALQVYVLPATTATSNLEVPCP